MSTTETTGPYPPRVVQVQIEALIDTWLREKAERNDLADSMFTDGNKNYQQGYADGLDRCIQGLKLLARSANRGQ